MRINDLITSYSKENDRVNKVREGIGITSNHILSKWAFDVILALDVTNKHIPLKVKEYGLYDDIKIFLSENNLMPNQAIFHFNQFVLDRIDIKFLTYGQYEKANNIFVFGKYRKLINIRTNNKFYSGKEIKKDKELRKIISDIPDNKLINFYGLSFILSKSFIDNSYELSYEINGQGVKKVL